jgi:hypothetical protein
MHCPYSLHFEFRKAVPYFFAMFHSLHTNNVFENYFLFDFNFLLIFYSKDFVDSDWKRSHKNNEIKLKINKYRSAK